MKRSTFFHVALAASFSALFIGHSSQAQTQPVANYMAAAEMKLPQTPAFDATSMAHASPKISINSQASNHHLQVHNPEMVELTIQLRNEKNELENGWVLESFSDSDARQTLQVADLKPGIYWVEISSPGKQAVNIRWEKK